MPLNILLLITYWHFISQNDFGDDGGRIDFLLGSHKARIRTGSSGVRKEGMYHILIVNGEIVPEWGSTGSRTHLERELACALFIWIAVLESQQSNRNNNYDNNRNIIFLRGGGKYHVYYYVLILLYIFRTFKPCFCFVFWRLHSLVFFALCINSMYRWKKMNNLSKNFVYTHAHAFSKCAY